MTTDSMVPVADGVRLRVLDTPGRERAFLLVHGLASNARLWDGVSRVLAEAGHRVVAVDLRGHGESDQPDDDSYGTGTAAADLVVLAEKLDLAGAVVAGQSWGGNVVVELAAVHPGVASGLALVDGGWIDLPNEFPSWRECERMLTPPPLDGVRAVDLEQRMRRAHPDWAEWAIAATAANLRVGEDGLVRRRLTIPHHLQILRSMWDHPPQRLFGDVTVPVLLIPAYGTQQAEMKRDRVERAASLLPEARIRGYEGADHDIHAQHPDELAADLLALARDVDSRDVDSQDGVR